MVLFKGILCNIELFTMQFFKHIIVLLIVCCVNTDSDMLCLIGNICLFSGHRMQHY